MDPAEVAKEDASRSLAILEALLWATLHAEEVIDIVRTSKHVDDQLAALSAHGFNTLQAHMILDIPLRRLSPRNVAALRAAIEELNAVPDDQLADQWGQGRLGQVRWEP